MKRTTKVNTPLALAPTVAASLTSITIRLNPCPGGSMELRKTARGLEFDVSETQLRFITVCLNVARLYSDEHLTFKIQDARTHDANPEESRWYRDPIIAAETCRRNDEWIRQYDLKCKAEKAHETSRARRLGL